MFDFIKSIFKKDPTKNYAKTAISDSLQVGDKISSFIPILKLWDVNDNDKRIKFADPGIASAIDGAYETAFKYASDYDAKAYAYIYFDSLKPTSGNIINLICECGLQGSSEASKFAQAYSVDNNGVIQRKIPVCNYLNKCVNAFSRKKTYAWSVVNETGAYQKALVTLPTSVAVLTCMQENTDVNQDTFNLLISELQKTISKNPHNKATMMGLGFCLEVLTEKGIEHALPEGDQCIELYKLALHYGNQVLIEAHASGNIEYNDLKEFFSNLELISRKILSNLSIEKTSEMNEKMFEYLGNLAKEPMKLREI